MKPEQITAWALDEASAEERLQLEAELRANPAAQKGADETKAFCAFLLAELRDESMALTEEQRARLVEGFSTGTPSAATAQSQPTAAKKIHSPAQPRWRTGPILRVAAAACLTLGGLWVWQEHGRRSRSEQLQVAEVAETRFKVQSPSSAALREGASPRARPMADMGKTGPTMTGNLAPISAPPLPPAQQPSSNLAVVQNPELGTISGLTGQDVSRLKVLEDQTAYGLGDGAMTLVADASSPTSQAQIPLIREALPEGIVKEGSGTLVLSGQNQRTAGLDINGGTLVISNASTIQADPLTTFSGGVMVGQPSGSTTTGPLAGGQFNNAASNTVVAAGSTAYRGASALPAIQAPPTVAAPAPRPTLVPLPGSPPVTEGYVTIAGNPTPLVADPMPDAHYFGSTTAPADRFQPEAEGRTKREEVAKIRPNVPSSNESYQRIVENELKDVAREPLSTFSIDVDTAAYANVRRFLNQNMIPPADAVRIEELVNYFPAAEEGPAPGAKDPFAVRVEMAPCPWQPTHRLARIAIKGRELGNERKPSNLVFLVDVSGSMDEPSKLPLVQQSLRMLTAQLGEEDRVTMVVYAGSSGMVLPSTSGEKKGEILAAIDNLKAGGSTHGSAGIQLAYEQAVANFIKEGVNRVILCTDGDFNVGVSSPEELEKLITKKARSGVFLSVLGFGTGNLKDRTMETLADKGNGNYAYIDSLSEARKVLVEQMSGTLVTIAKDVKIQVEFNPAMVRSYRLIGYENRLLAKEDFNDDTKDAGEIGAGHSVVALYEVVPANLPPGAEPRPAVDQLRYQQLPATPAPAQLADAAKSGEVMTVKLRYKEPDSALSKLIEVPAKDEGRTLTASTEEFKFSAAVAGFGLLLRDSNYKGTLSWETVRKLALDGKGTDKMGYRGEFLQLIDKARGLKETRP